MDVTSVTKKHCLRTEGAKLNSASGTTSPSVRCWLFSISSHVLTFAVRAVIFGVSELSAVRVSPYFGHTDPPPGRGPRRRVRGVAGGAL